MSILLIAAPASAEDSGLMNSFDCTDLTKLRQDADKDKSEAELTLGQLYLNEHCVKTNPHLAGYWIGKAAHKGYTPAQVTATQMYYSAGLYTQATEMAIQAANKGEPFTQFLLAKIYEQGLGVAQDKDKAAYWAKQSAAQGYYPGICVLGRYYLTGTGVQQDLIEADKWFILSSEPNAINGISTDFADDSLRGYKHIRTVLESQMPPKDVIEAKMRAARWKPAKH